MGRYSERRKRPARRKSAKEPRKRILVVCEGQSEYEYLEQFRRWARNQLVEVSIRGGAGVPLTVVTAARDEKKEAEKNAKRKSDDFLKYDSVWCVFDTEDGPTPHPNLDQAKQMARDNGISLAISNAAFELWLILHFREPPGAKTNTQLRRHLKDNYLPVYDKHIDLNSLAPKGKEFEQAYVKAVERARRLDEAAERDGEPHRNPTTGVYGVTEEIRNA